MRFPSNRELLSLRIASSISLSLPIITYPYPVCFFGLIPWVIAAEVTVPTLEKWSNSFWSVVAEEIFPTRIFLTILFLKNINVLRKKLFGVRDGLVYHKYNYITTHLPLSNLGKRIILKHQNAPMRKLSQKNKLNFRCPFCKKEIVSSKKTEIFYRSNWINGCYECFCLSISELTTVSFQAKNY